MSIWSRLGLPNKIFAGLAAMLALMAAILVVAIVSENEQERISDSLIGRLLPARTAARTLKQLVVAADDQGAWYLLSTDLADRKRFLQRYRANATEIDGWLRFVGDSPTSSSERTALDHVIRKWHRYLHGNERAFQLSSSGRIAPAQALYTKIPYTSVMAALNAYDAVLASQIADLSAQRLQVHRTRRIVLFALAFGAFGLAIVIAVRLGGSLRVRLGYISRAIDGVVHDDLARVAQSFRNIAGGDLNAPRYSCTRAPVRDNSEDELGLLAKSYNDLISGLREMSDRIDQSMLDAKKRHEAEERLAYLEQYDEATGLANRNLFRLQLDHAIRAANQGGSIGVAYLSLNGLKQIEMSFGQPFGEQAAQILAQRLIREVRKSDTAARAGDDEFAVSLNPVRDRDEALELVRGLIHGLSQPFKLDGHEVLINPSAGLGIYPEDGQDADDLMRNANTAMSHARRSNGGSVAVYNPRLRTESVERLTVESELRRAMDGREFEIHYQPIVEILGRRIARFEALLRWRHPRLGLLAPPSFLPYVEETPMMETLGGWVMQTACSQAQQWRQAGHDVGVSVNVSMRQVRGDLVAIVSEALASAALPASCLELELTESAILTDRVAARTILGSLKQAGISLAIDDFGTGYSSLAYLQTLPVDTLKIDRSFVTDITRKPFDEAIARAIILLGQSLGMRVIAEGVEDERQTSVLYRLGCRMMQGYFFGKPCPADQCLHLLQTAPSVARA